MKFLLQQLLRHSGRLLVEAQIGVGGNIRKSRSRTGTGFSATRSRLTCAHVCMYANDSMTPLARYTFFIDEEQRSGEDTGAHRGLLERERGADAYSGRRDDGGRHEVANW